jgi:hypothetical protein
MDGANLHKVAMMRLSCIECLEESDDDARGWRMYLDEDREDPGSELLIATYCPDCAVREFGPIRSE